MKPLNLLTQGLSLQSTFAPANGQSNLQAPDGETGVSSLLQGLDLGGGLDLPMQPHNESFGGLQSQGNDGGQGSEIQKIETLILLIKAEEDSSSQDSGDDGNTANPDNPAPQLPNPNGGPQNQQVAPANPQGSAPPAAGPAPTNSDSDVENGDATHGAKSTDKAPAGMTVAQIDQLDGGLAGKTGNQELKGAGTDGIQGSKHIQDIVAGQVQGGLSGTDADKEWQKLEVEEQAKDAPQANGKQASADMRHNGNLSGLQPSDEVASDSDLAFLQNEAKGAGQTKGGPSDKMNANDGETTGAQQVGQKILDGLGEAAKWIGKVAAKVFPEFSTLIKGASAGIDIGLHAAGAAADQQDVGQAAKKEAEDQLNPVNLIT